ncbi:MAG: glutamate synthase subunit beta [Dysgonamonadaceae bacterium]|jgi:glutamate synthase (NADPH/NADH) small chain|nr:glutamate synthase subunit beta [Dysgonamonadaceae bacterium]
MGNAKAFLTINRKEAGYRLVVDRIADFSEVEQTLNTEDRILQASRCMECGVPFCHWACPLGNIIPEWQDLLYKAKWFEAYSILSSTNNFPEFTGRICPALCEKSCVLNLEGQPLTVRENEAAIAEHAFQESYIKPQPPLIWTGEKVAIVGSGPSGLAAADMLNKKGYMVTIYEKDESIGGLLRLGIPDFKLNKGVIDRRLNLLEKEGIRFEVGIEVGKDIPAGKLLSQFDAVCLATGSAVPRDLSVEGRKLKGIHFALDFLKQQNRMVAGQVIDSDRQISAKNKRVLVIGGGDTGSDCVGTSIRQKARKVTQIEILPQPPEKYNPDTPWPYYPNILKTSSSHMEGCERRWSLATKRFIGENGNVNGVEVVEVEWLKDENGRFFMNETTKTEIISAELVLLSIGFMHPEQEGLLNELGVRYDVRGNVEAIRPNESSVAGVFVAGDATLGAGLVVRAIDSGRKAAEAIAKYLEIKNN